MKPLVKYSRVASYLEHLYDALNADLFNGELVRPVITLQSTPRSYGHLTVHDAWSVKGNGYRELNIGAGTLDRPIEYIICTLVHEMVHQYNLEVLSVQDCSRGGTYHNKLFKATAESVGLVVERTEKYGYSRTTPGDELLEWMLKNDVQEIHICRTNPATPAARIGTHTGDGGVELPTITTRTSHHRRYVCPCCRTIIRATKAVRVLCADCNGELFVEM